MIRIALRISGAMRANGFASATKWIGLSVAAARSMAFSGVRSSREEERSAALGNIVAALHADAVEMLCVSAHSPSRNQESGRKTTA